MTGREDAAHRYADAGWPVFPCVPGEKIPVTSHGFQDATTDHGQISQWWADRPERNVGIATGAPGPDVLDVDNHGEAGNGFAAFNSLKRAGLVPVPRAVVRTPSGGFHSYYQGTGQPSGRIRAHHIDYRGQGGYVVAPGSTVGGRPYVVVSRQPGAATFDWGAARHHLEPEAERRARAGNAERGTDVARLAGWVAKLQPGNRNDGLHWAANRVLEAGHGDQLGQLADAARSAGLDDREISRTLASAERTATGERVPFARHGDREAG